MNRAPVTSDGTRATEATLEYMQRATFITVPRGYLAAERISRGGVAGVRTPVCYQRPGRPDIDAERSRFEGFSHPANTSGIQSTRSSASTAVKVALRSYGYLGRDRQRNRGFFSGMLRGVRRPCEPPRESLFPLLNPLIRPVTSLLGCFGLYLSLIPDRGVADQLH
jgi:hypothetical protein